MSGLVTSVREGKLLIAGLELSGGVYADRQLGYTEETTADRGPEPCWS